MQYCNNNDNLITNPSLAWLSNGFRPTSVDASVRIHKKLIECPQLRAQGSTFFDISQDSIIFDKVLHVSIELIKYLRIKKRSYLKR